MAQKKKSTGRSTSLRRSTSKSGNAGRNTKNRRNEEPMDSAIRIEILLIGLLALAIVLFLCNFGVIGVAGDKISEVLFGVFGLLAYVVPIVLFVMIAFGMVNSGDRIATRKLIAGVVLFLMIGIVCDLLTTRPVQAESYQISEIFMQCKEARNGGGIIAGSLAYLLCHFLGLMGTVLVILVAAIICIVIITNKSFVAEVKKGGHRFYEMTKEDAAYRRDKAEQRRAEREEERRRAEDERERLKEAEENDKILRMDKRVSGVMMDTSLKGNKPEKVRDDMHEINVQGFDEKLHGSYADEAATGFDQAARNGDTAYMDDLEEPGSDDMKELSPGDWQYEEMIPDTTEPFDSRTEEDTCFEEDDHYAEEDDMYTEEEDGQVAMQTPPVSMPQRQRPAAAARSAKAASAGTVRSSSGSVGTVVTGEMYEKLHEKKPAVPKKYVFPPLKLLTKGSANTKSSDRELRETAERLRQTLHTFGVNVTITDYKQGPAVTRYELQPEQGVKVSKIVGLSDDIKLNLAATDIRIEAPIPGKAAIGIEVPNKENSSVMLRDLIDTKEFQEFNSKIAFAVGKDIAGKVVVADIAKMPHMLIAGATGSGKSVCINTLIMSILYKARPDEVKLIMVDPKVVELSVYNGIPHLLIPVVTDPKKAASALHWGVSEMTDRYQKFADCNVRDLKGYNKMISDRKANGETDVPEPMPQIVIIVDELADLMMVAPGEVEESICRLAQLARAAGIHLIIATQRPSVDVITGLIKANMPSRVAFSVSSSVDSRTILDMNGAEKLLGKGDMLFYPQGYSKPARIQGAFVSDKEVADVVEYLKNQKLGNTYGADIEEKIAHMGSGTAASDGASERDEYFADAGRFIIEKDKASIGMLQRMFKIGFNRAARIMDQLCDAGVVGEEEGTKPRKVLMSMEQFEQLIEELY